MGVGTQLIHSLIKPTEKSVADKMNSEELKAKKSIIIINKILRKNINNEQIKEYKTKTICSVLFLFIAYAINNQFGY